MLHAEFIKKAKLPLSGLLVNAPTGIETAFVSMGYFIKTEHDKNQTILVFLENASAFNKIMPVLMEQLAYDGLLWICYPKGSSSIKTDINRNVLWKMMEPFGVRPVNNVSFDANWSALRFRPIELVKSKI
jgi:hypothetical protein